MWIHYYCQSDSYWGYVVGTQIQTTIQNVSAEKYANLYLPLPSPAEQVEIVAFLNRETAKIDALVAEQQRLIELLKEKRQAVISHAVTKGLSPDAAMKPSRIDWLGDVPAHWAVGALRYFASFGTGSTPNRGIESYWNGRIPWVKTGEIDYSTILSTEETISSEGLESCSARLIAPGALMMALYGQGATRGRVAILGIEAACNQACAVIETDARVHAPYLHRFFESAYTFIREIGNETTQMNLNLEFVQGLKVPVPPLEEQRAISEYLEDRTRALDDLILGAQDAVVLLEERRSALISAAVTGQIDVRGLVPSEAA
jgi:type I restriction enzyme S subunit